MSTQKKPEWPKGPVRYDIDGLSTAMIMFIYIVIVATVVVAKLLIR